MDSLAKDSLADLRNHHEPPCLSLYQPTHRQGPEKRQDPIRFRNLVKEMEESLRAKHSASVVEALLEPFRALADDDAFWTYTREGLAVLGASGTFQVYKLQRPVPELGIVAASFHTKPLLRILQSADRFQILGLSLKAIRLFEGNRDALDEIALRQGVPRTLVEALGAEVTDPHLTVGSYGGKGVGGTPMHHGHGAKKDEVDKDAERFFRIVDRALLEHHSRPSGLPLLLAALPEHHHLFHQVSRNPFLLRSGIQIHPDALSIDALRERAWRAVEPNYLARLAELVDAFGEARTRKLGSDNLAQVSEAAAGGRVATLLIEADRQILGRIDAESGRMELAGVGDTEVDDLLDDLGELVASKKGDVVVVPGERMPTDTGVAAIYRY